MTRAQAALLDIIRAFKGEQQSDLEAALNGIMSHARTIQRLHAELQTLREKIGEALAVEGESRPNNGEPRVEERRK